MVERRTPPSDFQSLCEFETHLRQCCFCLSSTTHRFNSGHLQHSVSHITRSDCLSAFWNEPAAPSMMFWHARIHTQQMECLQLCCNEAYDGTADANANGWAYNGHLPAWVIYKLAEKGTINSLWFMNGQQRGDHRLIKFKVKWLLGLFFIQIQLRAK